MQKKLLEVGYSGRVEDLFAILKYRENIYSVYTGAPMDILSGSGRPQYLSALEDIVVHSKICHENGVRFNLVLNSPMPVNVVDQAKEIVGKLSPYKSYIDFVTITNPYLIECFSNAGYPVIASTFCDVNSVGSLRWYAENRVKGVVLSNAVSRNLELLKGIREAYPDMDMILLADESCAIPCALRQSHAFASGVGDQGFLKYLSKQCPINPEVPGKYINEKFSPVNLLKSSIIPPQNIAYYRDLGFKLKLVTRAYELKNAISTVDAYTGKDWQGNFFQLSHNEDKWCLHTEDMQELFQRWLTCNYGCVKCSMCDEFISKNIVALSSL